MKRVLSPWNPTIKRYASLNEAIADLGFPSTTQRTYVEVDASWGKDLETIFARAVSENGSECIVVLPEASEPYTVDTTQGFKVTPNIVSVDGWSSVNAGRSTFFEMTRAPGGLLGLGPGVRIAMTDPGSWQAPPQTSSFSYVDDAGNTNDLNSATCAVIGFDKPDMYAANFFVDPCVDMGGVAFSFLKFQNSAGTNSATVKQIASQGGWHGFQAYPNGETGLIEINADTYLIEDIWADARRPNGVKEGTSPIMINSVDNGGTWRRVTGIGNIKGMLTSWRCGGVTTMVDVTTIDSGTHGFNFEQSQANATYRLINCNAYFPSSTMHAAVGVYGADAVIEFIGGSVNGDTLRVQGYSNAPGGANNQTAGNITRKTMGGHDMPLNYFAP